jgi:hypothetical protein
MRCIIWQIFTENDLLSDDMIKKYHGKKNKSIGRMNGYRKLNRLLPGKAASSLVFPKPLPPRPL